MSKTIRQYIEEYEAGQKQTMGRHHVPLPEYYKETLVEFGQALRSTASGNERGSLLGALENIRIKVTRELRDAENLNYEEKRDREKKREFEFLPKLEKWIKKNVRLAAHLKLKGCRDGNGWREVMAIDWEKKQITCYKLILARWPDQSFVRVQLTTHGFDKILGPIELVPVDEVEASRMGYIRAGKRVKYTSLRKIL